MIQEDMTVEEFRNRKYILAVLPPAQQGIVRRSRDYATSTSIFLFSQEISVKFAITSANLARTAFPELKCEE